MGQLNRCVLSGAGPPSGSFRARFEGAKRPAGASVVLASVRPAPAAPVSMQVRVGSARLPFHSSSDAEEGALPQDGLQLLHSLPGEARLGGRSALGRPLPGPLVLRSCSIRPGLGGSLRAPVGQRADGDDGGGLRRKREGGWRVDDARTSPSAVPVHKGGLFSSDPHPLPAAQAHPCAVYLVFASTLTLLKDTGATVTGVLGYDGGKRAESYSPRSDKSDICSQTCCCGGVTLRSSEAFMSVCVIFLSTGIFIAPLQRQSTNRTLILYRQLAQW